ncbi:MliC family protein [Neisseria sp. Dent CA1/247]|uniref:Lipoprotein n=1 Tax=Neisseria zoodegmatis TaxID=326523 RepID=A0A378WV74_9NEIS|nr:MULTISPECIES: MliC family protein [Neisseria]MDO5069459.1 MliC family protein [Neisseria zoodegmatis]UOO76562.1 MliC family protein [Neisseria sp. Dent CA1/247]SUA44354.1 lipoprotein [Neisseria zoodegmatis]
MKFVKLLAPAAAALILAACASDGRQPHDHGHHGHHHGHDHSHGHSHDHGHAHGAASNFSCQNGFTVKVSRMGTDRISVNYGLQDQRMSANLESAVSGSGERYVSRDKKTEWHQKGNQAFLSFTDRYGNVTETSCNSSK